LGNNLISLGANLDRWHLRDVLFAKSVSCYVEALTGVERHIFGPCAAKLAGRPPTLEDARQGLCQQPDEAAFEQARTDLDVALQEASEGIRQQLAGKVEMREVIQLLAQTTDSIRTNSKKREEQALGVAEGLKRTAGLGTVTEFRAQVRLQIEGLTKLVEQMRADNRQMVMDLEAEMLVYRNKLDRAEAVANRDALTGLSNRRVLEARVEEYIRSGVRFCLLMIDLDRFKQINDRHGHLAGDELLRSFAMRLMEHLRHDDVAIRWGGDEFAVVLPAPLPEAILRGRELEQVMRGEYRLRLGGEVLPVKLGFSFGIAEHRVGETSDKLLARADELLLATKASRR
jgi:diguanylate cyclase (GGDEF)-like protein